MTKGATVPRRSAARRVVIRLLRRGSVRAGAVLLVAFFTCAIFGSWLAPHDPFEQHLENRLAPPSAGHVLGTDEFGRDVLSRVLHGTKISLGIGIVSVGIGVMIGGTLGLVAGYRGGWVDQLGMRIMDILLAFPSILLAVIVVAALGPSLKHAMIAVGVVSVPQYARLVRSSVLSLRACSFVEAERALGSPESKILLRTVVPHCIAPVLVQASLGLATAILDAAGLSFLGLGAQPPTPEWGAMLGAGREYVVHAPWVLLAPGIAILGTVLGFNLLGDGLRDALDPRLAALFSRPPKPRRLGNGPRVSEVCNA